MSGRPPLVVTTRAELRAALAGTAPGLVPTMGALHAGHAALISRAVAENAETVVSIFVNPTQFDRPDDLARYPRTFDADLDLVADLGAAVVFAPTAQEIYPPGFATKVEVGGLAERWEGVARPRHFDAVATVVAILLGFVRPARSYFGEKDWQQLQVVKRMHADLAMPGEIVACPTVRDADGLALSSRNGRLSPPAREAARLIPHTLARLSDLAAAGHDAAALVAAGGDAFAGAGDGITLDYLAVVDGATLEPVARPDEGSRILVAAVVDGVRLIDNVAPFPAAPRPGDGGSRRWD